MNHKLLTLLFAALCGTANIYAQNYPEMIKVEGGKFIMGNKAESPENEQPAHEVKLKSFSMAKTETTVLQWKTYCTATGRQMPEIPSWGWNDDHPIVNVSYDDALAYCEWLRDKTGGKYHLPTEAEWEFAARGGKQSIGYKYTGWIGIDMNGWYEGNSNKQIHAVAQKRANKSGLYDMRGNVWEWCKDWYGAYATGIQYNPKGPENGSTRVLRGGSFMDSADYCSASNRNSSEPGLRNFNIGFRVVLSQ